LGTSSKTTVSDKGDRSGYEPGQQCSARGDMQTQPGQSCKNNKIHGKNQKNQKKQRYEGNVWWGWGAQFLWNLWFFWFFWFSLGFLIVDQICPVLAGCLDRLPNLLAAWLTAWLASMPAQFAGHLAGWPEGAQGKIRRNPGAIAKAITEGSLQGY